MADFPSGRFEISVLVGPCSERAALLLMDEVVGVVEGRLGSVVALQSLEVVSEEELGLGG